MNTSSREIAFKDLTPSAVIEPAWIAEGSPDEASMIIYASPDGKFIVQLWECRTPVKLDVRDYPCDEFMTVIEGTVDVTDQEGNVQRRGAR